MKDRGPQPPDEAVRVPPAIIGLLLLLTVILATIFIIAAVTIQTP
jgi:hypothetical protein